MKNTNWRFMAIRRNTGPVKDSTNWKTFCGWKIGLSTSNRLSIIPIMLSITWAATPTELRFPITEYSIFRTGEVTFSYKNRKKGTSEIMTTTAVEFIRRFLLHILPKGFMRIRYYGFLANRYKRENLKNCRLLLGVPDTGIIIENKSVREIMLERTGHDITKCPFCKTGDLIAIKSIPKHTGSNPYEIIHEKRQNNLIQRE